jgi:hypothetical protein
MGTRRLMLTGIALVLFAPSVHAQRLARPWPSHPAVAFEQPSSSRPWRPLWVPPSREGAARQPTFWREGAVVGGILFGFLGAITGVGLCHFDDPCPHPVPYALGGFVLGGAAGAAVGARIGGGLRKH